MELEEFHRDFFQDVITMAEADGNYAEDEFFDQFQLSIVNQGKCLMTENGVAGFIFFLKRLDHLGSVVIHEQVA